MTHALLAFPFHAVPSARNAPGGAAAGAGARLTLETHANLPR